MMTGAFRFTLPVVMVLLCAPTHAGDISGDTAVRAIWTGIDSARNARNAERFSALITENSSFVFVNRRQTFDGRDAIHRNFLAQFPRTPPELSHQ